MNDSEKNHEQLLAELTDIRISLAESEATAVELRETERRYRQLAECSTDIIYIVNRDGQLQYANRCAAARIGFSPDALIGKNQEDLFPPKVAKLHLERIRRVFETGEEGEIDEPFHFGQNVVWLNVRAIPMRDEQGKIVSVMGVCRDITHRMQTDEELAKNRAMLQASIDCLPFDFFAIGADGRYILQNAMSKEYWGDTIGKRPEDICGNKDDLKIWLDNNRRAFNGEKVEYDVSLTYKGEKGYFHNVITPIRSGETTYGILGLNIDITKRILAEKALLEARDELELRVKERTAALETANEKLKCEISDRQAAEESLRHSRDELQTIYDGMFDGLLIADCETKRLVRANSSICQILGYSKEELLSMSVTDIHPADEHTSVLDRFQARGEERYSGSATARVLKKDGSILFAEIVGSKLIFRGRPCIAGFFRDITKRILTEQALAESETKYRHLIETTGTGYLILDGEGRVLDANEEYIRLSGHRELGEILGRKVTEWTASYDVERNAKEVEKCLHKGAVRQLEVDYVHPDGTIMPIEINANCIDTKQGRRILSLCRDISDRRHAQEALQKEHRTLKHLLQSSDHERQLIAYEIHDELAQQLAGAIMHFQIFDHKKDAKPIDAAKAYVTGMAMLQQSHFEVRRLINGVRPPILDESGVIEAIANLVHEESRHKELEIEFKSRVDFGRLAPILENTIYRIIQEGLANARKHSKSKKVRVSLLQRNECLQIAIQDWGIGFVPEDVKDNCYGLEGIRERTRLLGGRSSIKSKAGKGTHIAVELPLVERE